MPIGWHQSAMWHSCSHVDYRSAAPLDMDVKHTYYTTLETTPLSSALLLNTSIMTTQAFRYLDLPAEIGFMIYERLPRRIESSQLQPSA